MNASDDIIPSRTETPPPSAAMVTFLVIIVLIGATLRAATAGGSLWLDELHTAWTVQAEWQDIVPRAEIGNQSPAFFAVVKTSTELLGANEWTLRLPSLVAGVALIAMAWQAVRQWTGNDAAGVVAALAVALDPWCVLFSAEARAYSLVQLGGLIHLLLFSELIAEATWSRRIGWVIGGALLFYLHYTAALLVAAQVVAYVILWSSGRAPRYAPWLLAIDVVAIALLCLPAREQVLGIAAHRGDWAKFIAPASWQGFLDLFPLYAAIVGAVAVAAAWQAWRSTPNEEKEGPPRDLATAWILVACWLVVPLSLALVATLTDQARLLFLRYMTPALVAVPLAAGLAFASQSTNLGRWLAGAVLAIALVALPARWPIDSTPLVSLMHGDGWVAHGGQDWRAAAQFIEQHQPGRRWAVVVRSGFIEADRLTAEPTNQLLRSYCLAPVNSLYRVEMAGRTLIPLATSELGPLDTDALRALQYRDSAWLLVNGDEPTADDYIKLLDDALAPHGSRVLGAVKHVFPGVVLCEVRISKGP